MTSDFLGALSESTRLRELLHITLCTTRLRELHITLCTTRLRELHITLCTTWLQELHITLSAQRGYESYYILLSAQRLMKLKPFSPISCHLARVACMVWQAASPVWQFKIIVTWDARSLFGMPQLRNLTLRTCVLYHLDRLLDTIPFLSLNLVNVRTAFHTAPGLSTAWKIGHPNYYLVPRAQCIWLPSSLCINDLSHKYEAQVWCIFRWWYKSPLDKLDEFEHGILAV
jgi:hypothetical protein